jgi:chromosome segregation ATPase
LEKRQAVSMRIKVDDRTRLEEVQKILEEKEQDTAMAAEIGQTLLEKNVQLENEIGQLHTKLNEYQRILTKLEEIQTEVQSPPLFLSSSSSPLFYSLRLENLRMAITMDSSTIPTQFWRDFRSIPL